MVKPCVYMLSSKPNGTLYVGVTGNLSARVQSHSGRRDPESFTARYGVTRLVWWEAHPTVASAIQREKTIKGYPRQWKVNLIAEANPDWELICPVTGVILGEG